MYRHCIYCSADLKTNAAIEGFPIGRTVAFDAAKGHLWAVCGKCGRWNLAPLEERWEPVEQAEKAFRDTRLRAQKENIGVASLAGLKLIRIGSALTGEVAAWRYGGALMRRRRQWLLTSGVAMGGSLAAAGIQLAGVLATGGGFLGAAALYPAVRTFWDLYAASFPVGFARTGGEFGKRFVVRRRDLNGAYLAPGADGSAGLVLPALYPHDSNTPIRVEVGPDEFGSLLGRALLFTNRKGARAGDVERAAAVLANAGTADKYLQDAVKREDGLGILMSHFRENVVGTATPTRSILRARPLDQEAALTTAYLQHAVSKPRLMALEMALHEQQERRALEGELSVLEVAWREAEEIAGIADRLAIAPGDG
jgi:hypothetical protein